MDEYDDYEDEQFNAYFEAEQQRKWESGEYVDHCKGCSGEDCCCCQYNPNLENRE